jgi:hypothetical protein
MMSSPMPFSSVSLRCNCAMSASLRGCPTEPSDKCFFGSLSNSPRMMRGASTINAPMIEPKPAVDDWPRCVAFSCASQRARMWKSGKHTLSFWSVNKRTCRCAGGSRRNSLDPFSRTFATCAQLESLKALAICRLTFRRATCARRFSPTKISPAFVRCGRSVRDNADDGTRHRQQERRVFPGAGKPLGIFRKQLTKPSPRPSTIKSSPKRPSYRNRSNQARLGFRRSLGLACDQKKLNSVDNLPLATLKK